jgi:hypothetical protein
LGRARVVVAAAFLLAAAPAGASADIVRTPAAHSVFTLQPNGVLGVLEHLDVKADAATPATWQVTMQRGELFAEPSLVLGGRRYRPGDGKRPGTYRISRGSSGVRFDWLQPPGSRPVRLGYKLALFGTAYTDVVDLRVPVWESWPTPVEHLTAALKLPRVPRRRAIVWIEPRALAGHITTVGREIRLSAPNVDADRPVTLRSVLPRGVLTSADGLNVEPKPGLAAVLAQRDSGGRTWWPWAVAAAAVAVLSVLVVLRTTRSRRPLPR